MRTRLITALALGVLALSTVPASAAAGSEYQGGCGYDTISGSGTQGEETVWSGVIYSATVVYSQTPADNPVSATVTCTIEVDGVAAVTTPFSGTGVVAGWQVIQFTARFDSVIEMCETVDYTDDTPTTTHCSGPIVIEVPPLDCIDCGPWPVLDPVICQVFATLDPYDVPGVVEVESDGDIHLAGEPFWDCPPYDEWT